MGFQTHFIEVTPGVTLAVTIEQGNPINNVISINNSAELTTIIAQIASIAKKAVQGHGLASYRRDAANLGINPHSLDEMPECGTMRTETNPYLPD